MTARRHKGNVAGLVGARPWHRALDSTDGLRKVPAGDGQASEAVRPRLRVRLRALTSSWPRAVCRLLEGGESAVVRVLVAEVRGSAPRDAGTCMLVTHTETYGTIGGGNLEWEGMRTARELLATEQLPCSVQVRRLVLGRELAQCCGGVVQLWVERFTRQDLPVLRRLARPVASVTAVLTIASSTGVVRQLRPHGASDSTALRVSSTGDGLVTLLEPLEKRHPPLWLFGAGHVGHALIHILGDLPFDVTWIDSRNELFPDALPDNVRSTSVQTPVGTIDSAPPDVLFLVMTHDHALDYDLCHRILERGKFRWLGLIGSKSKGARFRSRLARDGLSPEQIARLTCPIGIEGVPSKLPAAIAVAVAAQLLRGVGEASAADYREPVAAAISVEPAAPAIAVGSVAATDSVAPQTPGARQATGSPTALKALPATLTSAQADLGVDNTSGTGKPHALEDCSPQDCETCTGRRSDGRPWDRP